MILRNLIIRRTLVSNLFEGFSKFPFINKVRAESNLSISKAPFKINQQPKFKDGLQCYEINKRFHSSARINKKLRKDDDLQPELNEQPFEDGEFVLSQTHFDRKILAKDIGRKFTVGENVITALNSVYGIERRRALSMMQSQKFLLVADTTILQTLYFLAKMNISPEQIQRIPWLLMYEHEILQKKIDKIVAPALFKNIEHGLGFCYLPERRINILKSFFSHEAKDFPNHRNRLYYMADMLEVPVALVTERIVKPHRLMTMDFKRITEFVDLLRKYDVSNNDILRDLWIFFHNVDRSKERLQAITKVGCTRPRLWMCRCTDEVFKTTVKHYEDKKLILEGGSMTVVEYLAEQLECFPEEIRSHCDTNPLLLRVRVSKLQSMLDMLLSEGITKEAIRTSPRVLQHSEDKLRKRIHRLKNLGYQPISCATLFKSGTKFEIFCKNLRENGLRNERTTQDRSTGSIKDPWLKPTQDLF